MTAWELAELLADHALCARHLVSLKVCNSPRSATRKLSTMHGRGEVGFAWRWRRGGTKPEYYYTNADLKVDNKQHESLLSEAFVLLAPKAKGVLRGAKNVDQSLLPDMTMIFQSASGEESPHDFELDLRTMPLTRMRGRFALYKDSDNVLLVVTTGGQRRLKNLMEAAAEVPKLHELAMFSTFERFESDPFGEVWTGLDGEDYELDLR